MTTGANIGLLPHDELAAAVASVDIEAVKRKFRVLRAQGVPFEFSEALGNWYSGHPSLDQWILIPRSRTSKVGRIRHEVRAIERCLEWHQDIVKLVGYHREKVPRGPDDLFHEFDYAMVALVQAVWSPGRPPAADWFTSDLPHLVEHLLRSSGNGWSLPLAAAIENAGAVFAERGSRPSADRVKNFAHEAAWAVACREILASGDALPAAPPQRVWKAPGKTSPFESLWSPAPRRLSPIPQPVVSIGYNVGFPPYEVLKESVEAFNLDEARLLIGARGEELRETNEEFVRSLPGSLGAWYTGRPWLYVMDRRIDWRPPKYADPNFVDVKVDYVVRCLELLHSWYEDLVAIVEQHKHLVTQTIDTGDAECLEPAVIDLVQHFDALCPEEAWYLEISLFLQLLVEAAGAEMTNEMHKTIDDAANTRFTSWASPTPEKLNDFANVAAWAVASRGLDARYS